jgi:hypothetical protein
MHRESVEEVCMGIDSVDVGHRARGGLRLAGCEENIWHKPAEPVVVAWRPEQWTDLRENVE